MQILGRSGVTMITKLNDKLDEQIPNTLQCNYIDMAGKKFVPNLAKH